MLHIAPLETYLGVSTDARCVAQRQPSDPGARILLEALLNNAGRAGTVTQDCHITKKAMPLGNTHTFVYPAMRIGCPAPAK